MNARSRLVSALSGCLIVVISTSACTAARDKEDGAPSEVTTSAHVSAIEDPGAVSGWSNLCEVLGSSLVAEAFASNGYTVEEAYAFDDTLGCAITLSQGGRGEMQMNVFIETFVSGSQAKSMYSRKTDFDVASESGSQSDFALGLPHGFVSDLPIADAWEQGVIRVGTDAGEYDEVIAVAQYDAVIISSITRFYSKPDLYCEEGVGAPSDGRCEVSASQLQVWLAETYMPTVLDQILLAYDVDG